MSASEYLAQHITLGITVFIMSSGASVKLTASNLTPLFIVILLSHFAHVHHFVSPINVSFIEDVWSHHPVSTDASSMKLKNLVLSAFPSQHKAVSAFITVLEKPERVRKKKVCSVIFVLLIVLCKCEEIKESSSLADVARAVVECWSLVKNALHGVNADP